VAADQAAPSTERELTIERQTPAAGTPGGLSTPITLFIYPKAPDAPGKISADGELEVPSVLRLSAKDAKALLDRMGLRPSFEAATDKVPSRDRAFTVASQTPASGSKVPHGSAIRLRVYPAFED
jgi:beta-lactam-binding protein with PASTA domain